MAAFEQLGVFYLGKRYDLASRTRRDELVLYDAKDLVTHAVCVGMTGSGKTGLGIAVIEEAAIDNIPVIAIDPKGDLANLALTFPELTGADFAPWVNPSDAAAAGMEVEPFAARQAERWRAGLAEWGQDGDRIARLQAAARVKVFTPGSRAGTPLALLTSLAGPADQEPEDAAARLTSTADSLLALAGIQAEAHGRERTLLATILARPPAGPAAADLAWLVQQIQRPSFERIGVLDLESFFPAKERQELALRFNSVLAGPGFDVWLEGAPLDPDALLYDADGNPRVAIVSIAHLGDAERMLVVSLLLNAIVTWTRRQRGTSSLRALVYMDEVFGYLPPVANPPSKAPLLTLLKQARAYGVGVMLATQNPVDLDYKALSNTGTWFLGKLQTERDKARVLDGLEGITAGLDRATLDSTLSALGSRVFLMHNVHEPAPVVFETRWTLSYLRGPLGRDEIRRLNAAPAPAAESQAGSPRDLARQASAGASPAAAGERPVVPAGIPEVFFPASGSDTRAAVLYGSAVVHFTDRKHGIDVVQDVNVVTGFCAGAVPVDWADATNATARPDQLLMKAPDNASFVMPPAAALDPKRYPDWRRDFADWIGRDRPLTIYVAPAVKLASAPGESERDFRVRVQLAGREARDAAVATLRAKYAAKLARAAEKVRKAEETIAREQQQVSHQRLQTAVSIGATLFGALMGRKVASAANLGRATTAVRGVGRAAKESADVAQAQERLERARQELTALEQEIEAAAGAISSAADPQVELVSIRARRGAIDVRLIALAWVPTSSPGVTRTT